ncbi:acetylglucosaminyltransferase family protein [Klebsormidium nitens]|uniref:Acetylglucosaminyltransferase family protein n=1 Tax=Klebsormidium nitens TaxID=105231 RepID=A0A1Y1HZS2_KLENI|nr:acetylglucosaminyltransferase family protein [Klebsormidium nitens]|eukprot:GAQ84180.1 acetylglucosaminyltransferase family protein [Klebsormidium nitens]
MGFCHINDFSLSIAIHSPRRYWVRTGKASCTQDGLTGVRRTKWLIPICICGLLFLCTVLGGINFSRQPAVRAAPQLSPLLRESRVGALLPPAVGGAQAAPPAIAYLIMASKGSLLQLQRLLLAVWHPHNVYLLHLDAEASAHEHETLADFVKNEALFRECDNVQIVPQPNLVTYTGPTMLATTLHGMAILLKIRKEWKWFINLSAADYPLATQDDILYALSHVDESRNFMALWPRLAWKVAERTQRIVMDASIFHNVKQDLAYMPAQRTDPTLFKLVTGSAWVTLSRPFVEYVIMGWENLPRLALMYFTNTVSSPEGYLHTVMCNSAFRASIINTELRHITWDTPPKQHPRTLAPNDFDAMAETGAMFARKFTLDESLPLLDRIDAEILGRSGGGFPRGGWCRRTDKEKFVASKDGRRSRGGDEDASSRTRFLGVDLELAGRVRTGVARNETSEPQALGAEQVGTGEHNQTEGQGAKPSASLTGEATGLSEEKDTQDVQGGDSAAAGANAEGGEASAVDNPPAFGNGRLTSQRGETPETAGSLEDQTKVAGTATEDRLAGAVLDSDRSEIVAEGGHDKAASAGGRQVTAGGAAPLLQGGEPFSEAQELEATRERGPGALTEDTNGSLTEGATSRRRLRSISTDLDPAGAGDEGLAKDLTSDWRGCDPFDGSYFLQPTERVHKLIDLIEVALNSSEGDLCSVYHEIVRKPSK